jgi:hypothetical protein
LVRLQAAIAGFTGTPRRLPRSDAPGSTADKVFLWSVDPCASRGAAGDTSAMSAQALAMNRISCRMLPRRKVEISKEQRMQSDWIAFLSNDCTA